MNSQQIATDDRRATLREALLAVIANISSADVAALGQTERFSQIKGWDSMSVLELVSAVYQDLGIDLAPEDLDGVDAIVDFVERVAKAQQEQGRCTPQ